MKYLKSCISIAALITFVTIAFIVLKPSTANAATCPGGGNFGAGIGYGYFTCTNPALSNDDDVFPNQLGAVASAPTSSAMASALESAITSQLNGSAGNSDLSTGAAFIIDTMMGVSAGSCDRTVCDTTVAQWEALVTEYGGHNLIKYNTSFNWTCGITDTLYDPTANDDFFFTLQQGESLLECSEPGAAVQATVPVIEFLSPTTGGVVFTIKVDCGNPIGSLQAIPTIPTDTMSGLVQVKNMTTGVVTNWTSGEVILTDDSNASGDSSGNINGAGAYSVKVPDGDEFSLSVSGGPTGDSGPYTDYQGAASFTDAASGVGAPYNCGPTNYLIQVAGKTSSPPENHTPACKTIGNNTSYNFVYTGTSTICTGSTCCTSNCGGNAPVFTCNTGSYDVTPVVSPDTAYIGADYPASITFNTSGNFESDSNNPYNDNLSQSVNQTSQLTVEATDTDSGLGITSPVTYNLSPGSSSAGPLSLRTTVGLYSVPYQVKIVNVVVDPDPAAHWAPVPSSNPTAETPAAPPASSYTNKTTTVAAPVYQTTEVAGNPTTGYYTKEDIKTTYTYTKTTTTTATKGPCIDFNIQAGYCLVYGPGTPGGTSTTVVATDTSDQYYYYITWVSTPNVECPPPVNVQVGYQPYMKVYGGDVMAGSTFDPGLTTSCTPLSGQASNIVGWNYDTPNYSGGGTEYAGYALGAIDGFATNQESGNAGIGLSFASVSNNSPSSGEFGGSFVPVSCAPDFFGAKPASAPAPTSSNLSNIASGSYYQNGPFTINGGSVNTGNHVAIYVNGNVYINGNITLSGTWTTIGDIPSFELIVQNGNIYINNSVTRLDGLYIAQDLNQSGTGTIYDCSVGQGGVEVPASGSQFSSLCFQPLTVNGSFIATQVDLMRTTSPVNYTSSTNTLFYSTGDTSTSNNASEIFNYSPAVWLGLTNNSLLGTNSNNTILNNYNSITSLPPVL